MKFKLGQIVRLRKEYDTGNYHRGMEIVELRGNLGPKGMFVYRLGIKREPDDCFVEVREDQIEIDTQEG